VATWNPIWNWKLIDATAIDKIMTMSTYASAWATWEKYFNLAVSTIKPEKLGIGLLTTTPYSDSELKMRFDKIKESNIQEIDIWMMPIPENWWPFLEKFQH